MKNKTQHIKSTYRPVLSFIICCILFANLLSLSARAQQIVTCQGDSVVLTLIGYRGTIQWENSPDGTSWTAIAGATTDSLGIDVNNIRFYRAAVTEGTCLPYYSDTILIGVNPLPSVVASSDVTICEGESTTLSVNGASFYSWSPTIGLSNPVIFNPVASPIITTTYIVTGTDGNGCTNKDTVIVTVNPSPVANAGADKTICEEDTVIVIATGGGTYSWSSGASTDSLIISPITTTNYIVTVTGANGCIDIDTVVVTVTSIPTADAGLDTIVCEGESIALIASGGSTYSWSSGDNTAQTIVTPTSTTTYTVTVSIGSCTDSDQAVVIVNANPIANAGANETICDGESATLTASGGNTYSWSSGDNTAQTIVNPSSTSTYTVTVTDINTCTAIDQAVVTVNTNPTANAGADETICDGETTTLTAGGGSTYSWSSGDNTAQTIVTPTSTTTYTVTVTAVNNCTDVDEVIVTVNAPPTANAGADQTICEGESATLTASGGSAYSWSSGDNTVQTIVSPTSTITYTVTASVGSCSDTDEAVVTVNPSPTVNAGTSETICEGESATLTASGGSAYSWSSGDNSAQTIVSPTSTTTYTVTASIGSCSDTDEAIVTVNPKPTANSGSDVTICDGETTTLTAIGGGTYSWSSGDNTAQTIVSPTTITTYTVTVSVNSCTDVDEVVVAVGSIPTANAGTDATICEGESATLTASGGSTYSWSSGDNTAQTIISPTLTATYIVTVSVGSCSDTDEAVVTVNPNPTANAGSDVIICDGETITLTATGGGAYSWSSGDNTAQTIVTPTSTTTYTVTVTDINTCTNTAETIITVNPIPTANAGVDTAICEGESIVLTVSGNGNSYEWSTTETTTSITVTPTATITYTVTATISSSGCTATDEVVVTVNPIPTANAGTDQSICQGDTAIIGATGGGTYEWSTGETTDSITIGPQTASTCYTVTITLNGCTNTDKVCLANISITAGATSDKTICEGESQGLSAWGWGASSFEWSTGQTTPSITVSPTTTTTYIVTATSFGCTDSEDVIVTVNPQPPADAGIDVTICNGNSATLTATGGDGYEWNSGETIASITVTPTSTTTYTVIVTGVNGCTDTDDVVVDPLPIANAGSDETICDGESTILTATGGDTYNWNTGPTTASITVSPTVTTTYTITVTETISGCTHSDEVAVIVNPIPTANAGTDVTITCGVCIDIGATGGGTYNWNTAETTDTITVSPPLTTTYTVTVTLNGCTDSDEVVVTVSTPVCPATVTDIDGNVYNTVQIGCQCWMHENLNVTNDPLGNPITKYCYNNIAAYCDTFGGFYDWYNAMNGSTTPGIQGICPDGWHMPRDCEFVTLMEKVAELYGGTTADVGDKLMKSGETPDRCFGITPPCGVSGFDAAHPGMGLSWGGPPTSWLGIYDYSYFWTSNYEIYSSTHICRYVTKIGSFRSMVWANVYPLEGMSIRCVKD